MTSVMRMVVVVVILALAPMRAHADILLSVAPVNPGPIVEGSTAVFEVFARSTTGNQPFGLFGFDLIVTTSAGVPLTDSRGGHFTNPATNLLGGSGWFFQTNPAIASFDGQSTGSIPSFGDTNIRIGTVTLSTAARPAGGGFPAFPAATPGNYLMDFRDVTTLTPGFVPIPGSGLTTSFTIITAVPEPSSMALLCVAGGAVWIYRRRAKKN